MDILMQPKSYQNVFGKLDWQSLPFQLGFVIYHNNSTLIKGNKVPFLFLGTWSERNRESNGKRNMVHGFVSTQCLLWTPLPIKFFFGVKFTNKVWFTHTYHHPSNVFFSSSSSSQVTWNLDPSTVFCSLFSW